MNRLRTRFSLILCSILLIATLLSVLILYLLSKSGLVEATYITETRDPVAQDAILQAILAEGLPDVPVVSPSLLPDKDKRLLLPWLTSVYPLTGEPRTPFVFDPVTGRITGLESNLLKRIVLSSRFFKFRVDLPAGIVIGSIPFLGLLVGIGLSLVMSRSITQPVSQLAEAARAIGCRDLRYRVKAKGSQEIQDLAQSFNRMAEQLEHAETTRRNLMADVAHELRTPLAVLDGNLRAMLDGVHALNEAEIALLYEQTHHLNRLVEDLRELSLAEADRLPLHRREVDLIHLVRETIAHFDLLAREQKIQFASEFEQPFPNPCLDEDRMRQVLHNLLANAFRYTPAGGKVTILVKQSPQEHAVEITVTDTGVGIAAERLPHIFDRFFRAEETTGCDLTGSGLGLAIVKALVEAQGGQVQAESAGRDRGSTFRIIFPFS
jgi:signal transduction histidine kinase